MAAGLGVQLMGEADSGEVTRLLRRWSRGDRQAIDQLMPLVYDDLRRLARRYLQGERRDHTLETSALVNESFVRLAGHDQMDWRCRVHFLAIAAKTMRRILVDHARKRRSHKRGGESSRLSLDEVQLATCERPVDVLALEEALQSLAAVDPVRSRIVELRFFGGLTNAEIGEVLEVSLSTVERQWRLARAWLYANLSAAAG